ncbi:MAG: BREX system P-loop protein BrxC [Bacteroidales bacterium]|nr:BREX system P-loop protein BrxC [Bacteroidales bacterium]
MIFGELYEKSLDRTVNPAVSASDLSDITVETEINEYVFTKEIIGNLYKVLLNIKKNQGSHTGIWINGYFGSGKSHFLKYTSYCLKKKYAEKAFDRLIEAVRELPDDDLLDLETGLSSGLLELKNWYAQKADVDIIMFNIGEVHDVNADRDTAFTKIFWNKFNEMRGFNGFNLALAQHLEKALADDGKFEEFKAYVKSKGYDWKANITRFAGARLDLALEMAKEVDGNLATDVIREKIKTDRINVSVEAFADEIKNYIGNKNNDNYRMLFFVDEVSQFVQNHGDLLLQLQSLVEHLYKVCQSKVWIACTAQQTLDEVVTGAGGIANPNNAIGKILGRFEVRASLQGTSSDYITRKRILDKKGEAELVLAELWERNKQKLDAQFILPSIYNAYRSKEDFVAYYPFVPYQFQLIRKVLNSFVKMNYVDQQVKGNERSLLNITFSIAKETRDWEVGKYIIPFDKFFGAMFQGSMQHLGQVALDNANKAVNQIEDEEKRKFYIRVVYILFMICNLGDADKPSFPANIDNVVTLMMTKFDDNRAGIRSEVEKVLSYLMDKVVIRMEKTRNGNDVYEFYTEEESQVAEMIKNQDVDGSTYSGMLFKIINDYFINSSNKETYATRDFNIICYVNGRNKLSSKGDVTVEFLTTSASDSPAQFSLNNPKDHLVFFLVQMWNNDKELNQKFYYYCQVQCFAQQPVANINATRSEIRRKFSERAKEMYDNEIRPKVYEILNTCPIISGQNILELGVMKGKERYKKALALHFETLYEFAKVVDKPEVPRNPTDLRAKILRPADQNLMEMPLSSAEAKMVDYLEKQPHDVSVDDVVKNFEKVPYGWSEVASIYVLNELVRRARYSFSYNNAPNASRQDVAQNILRDKSKFTVKKTRAISQDVINNFINAWKHIFNDMNMAVSNDSMELYRSCRESEGSAMNKLLKDYRTLSRKLASRPFVGKIDEAVALMEDWATIRDQKNFFETIAEARDSAATLFDHCKTVASFVDGQYDKYEDTVKFVKDNSDNFNFISSDREEAVRQIKGIESDPEPWKGMPAYIKMKRELDGSLQERRAALVKDVKAKYNEVFDELDAYAKSVNVPAHKYADRDRTIAQKTSTDNFYALEANANVDAFRQEQMNRINAAIERPAATVGTNAPKPIRTCRAITLKTHTAKPISTEEDVNAYLQGLKAQIMEHLQNDNDIIIN